jgi:Zn-dependent M28 family amino/carboxypeptidase
MLEWLLAELQEAGWQAEIQEGEMLGHPIRNVVARRGDAPAQVILGAHYDSRLVADQDTDPQMRQQAVTGANDGASGVAVLLELARVLPEEAAQTTWLVFFDAEDQGNISGWDWILGSRLFAESLEQLPEAVVIVDMVGDANLQLPREGNSDEAVASEIWAAAAELGYVDIFRDEIKYHMLDDHIPFIERGIPAVDIIDFDYPYWHTAEDTLDKVSAESLQVVGDTLLSWLTP